MATKEISSKQYVDYNINDINISNTFKELMLTAVGSESALSIAVDKVKTLKAEGYLTEEEMASIISKLFQETIPSVTQNAMNMAYQIEVQNRNGKYEINKLIEDTLLTSEQRDLTVAQNISTVAGSEVNENQAKEIQRKSASELWLSIGKLVKEYNLTSVPTDLNTILPASSFGSDSIPDVQKAKILKDIDLETKQIEKLSKDIEVETANITNISANTDLINAKIDKEYGENGLVYYQTLHTQRQIEAFDDNAVQHAVNASSTFMSMLISNGDYSLITQEQADAWNTGIEYLINKGNS